MLVLGEAVIGCLEAEGTSEWHLPLETDIEIVEDVSISISEEVIA